jgi:hypothetical protein
MVEKALQCALSDPVRPVVISGAKSPIEAGANAAAGGAESSMDECERLRILSRVVNGRSEKMLSNQVAAFAEEFECLLVGGLPRFRWN